MQQYILTKRSILLIILISGILLQSPITLYSHPTNAAYQSFTQQTEPDPQHNLPFFPLGIYGVQNSSEIWESWRQRFNTVVFGFAEVEDFEVLDIEDMLFTCDVLGMNVLFETSYFLRENAMDDLMDLILSVVDHPSIYAWYILDEPGLGSNNSIMDENLIRTAVETIHKIDDRPTFVQFTLNTINESLWMNSYSTVPDFVDIISVDPYPNMPYMNHSMVSNWIDTIHKYNMGRAQVWTVLTAQDFTNSYGAWGFDIPTEAEYMMDAVLALQRDVEGLLWFAFNQITTVDLGVFTYPNSWTALGNVVHRISQIIPIIMGREDTIQPISLIEKIEASSIKRGNQTVLLLANHDYFWNGSETEWRLKNLTINLNAPDVKSISRIEPDGPVPLDFVTMDSLVSFNITIDGGMIILIESSELITLSEWGNLLGYLPIQLLLTVTIWIFWNNKRTGKRTA